MIVVAIALSCCSQIDSTRHIDSICMLTLCYNTLFLKYSSILYSILYLGSSEIVSGCCSAILFAYQAHKKDDKANRSLGYLAY